MDHGVSTVCLRDGAGNAAPEAVAHLVDFTRRLTGTKGRALKIDFAGRDRRGLALENSVAAAARGVSRLWASALGGERAGASTPVELLLLNLRCLNWRETNRAHAVVDYCQAAAATLGRGIPANYPLVGRDAFRTATGVHAAAIDKALNDGDPLLADLIYSSVPARALGRIRGNLHRKPFGHGQRRVRLTPEKRPKIVRTDQPHPRLGKGESRGTHP